MPVSKLQLAKQVLQRHALLALRTDYTKQLKFIHDTLGIERVRLHGIFDDDMRTLSDLSQMFPVPSAESFTEENFRASSLARAGRSACGAWGSGWQSWRTKACWLALGL